MRHVSFSNPFEIPLTTPPPSGVYLTQGLWKADLVLCVKKEDMIAVGDKVKLNVMLSRELLNKAREEAKKKGFSSLSEYVRLAIREKIENA